ESGKRVPEHRHLRLRRVKPEHRHFRDREPPAPGQKQDLHVEGESVDLRLAEELARDISAEELEAALCVENARDRQCPYEEISRLAEEAPVGGLLFPDELFLKGTRADGDRNSDEPIAELSPFGKRRRKIDVGDEDGISPGEGDAGANRRALSAVLLESL